MSHDHHHGHAHSHDHSHHHSHEGHNHGRKLGFLTILSAVYLCAEVVGGLMSGSLALLADAGHMAVDVMAMALGLFALWVARRPPTPEKTYGYYRAEILAALTNGAFLVAVSVGIVIEALQRFRTPHEVHAELMGLVALGGLFINLMALFVLRKEGHSSLNMRAIWLHVLTDTLGSVGAMTAAFLVYQFGWTMADTVVSILIAVFILWGSWKLLSESVNVLLEGVPKGFQLNEIRTAMLEVSGVTGVHDLHVWTMSAGVHSLSAHVRVESKLDHAVVLENLINSLKKMHIEHVTIQIESPTFIHQEGIHVHL